MVSDESRVLTYITALACGLFLALSVHIGLTAFGVGLAGVTPASFTTNKDQIDIALAWWAIGIAGGLGSLAAIVLAKRLNSPSLQIMRLAVAVAFFCILAAAGQKAAAPPGGEAAITVAINLAAMTLGGFMAFFAAHFAVRR